MLDLPQLNKAQLDEYRTLYPRMEEYFGIWLCEENAFVSLAGFVANTDLKLHIQGNLNHPPVVQVDNLLDSGLSNLTKAETSEEVEMKAVAGEKPFATGLNGRGEMIAVVPIQGTLMKQQSSFSSATSTVRARRDIRNAVNDEDVQGIMLFVESPGGKSAGTKELADEVRRANEKKPVRAFIEDIGASAAFWVASQARSVSANGPAVVGSIGTYGVVFDASQMAEKAGVKVHVIRSGEFKGQGELGAPLSEEFLGKLQERVDGLNEFFIDAVSDGRKMSKKRVRELATGETFLAAAAVENGLIDRVETFEEALENFNTKMRGSSKSSRVSVPSTNSEALEEQETEDMAASYKEIKAACPGADNDFICSQLDAEVSVEEAKEAWTTFLAAERLTLQKQLAEAQASTSSTEDVKVVEKTEAPGLKSTNLVEGKARAGNANGGAIGDYEDAREELDAKTRDYMSKHPGVSRKDAIVKVCRANKELYQRATVEHNIAYAKRKGNSVKQAEEATLASFAE